MSSQRSFSGSNAGSQYNTQSGNDNVSLVIPTDKLKYICSVINLVSKIGKDLILEVDGEENVVTFRALNDAKSAFVSIEFDEHFFADAVFPSTSFSCRVPARPICAIFANTKNVDHIRMRTEKPDSSALYLVFEQVMFNKITRTHRFTYQECEILNVVFDEGEAHLLQCLPKTFAKLLGHLHNAPELSIEASPTMFAVSSFHNTKLATEKKEQLKSGVSVSVREFDRYEYKHRDHSSDNTISHLILCSKEVCIHSRVDGVLLLNSFGL
jgi:hypothetical protein